MMANSVSIEAAVPALKINVKFKFWMSLLALLAIIFLCIVLISDGMYNPQKFNISKITLTGDAAHVDRASLQKTVNQMIDGNYFSMNTGKIISALQELPWVEKVRVRRLWPDTLLINIEEHQPIAMWGEKKWLTTKGKLVSLPLPENIVLPRVSGPSSQVGQVWSRYQRWASMFARDGLRLRSMNLSRQHLFTLRVEYATRLENTADGFSMILSESNSDQQLEAFLKSRRLALISYPGSIKTVDLRYPSGFSISRYEPINLAKTDE